MAKDSCIEPDATMVKGYPTYAFKGGSTTMARQYYEYKKGPIPKGHVLIRTCRNRLCVNPAHMKPVPIKERPKHISYLHGDQNPNTRLSEKQLDTIRKLRDNGESVRNLSLRFMVSKSLIYKILQGIRRKHG